MFFHESHLNRFSSYPCLTTGNYIYGGKIGIPVYCIWWDAMGYQIHDVLWSSYMLYFPIKRYCSHRPISRCGISNDGGMTRPRMPCFQHFTNTSLYHWQSQGLWMMGRPQTCFPRGCRCPWENLGQWLVQFIGRPIPIFQLVVWPCRIGG